MKRGSAMLVGGIHIGAQVEQHFHRGGLAPHGGLVKQEGPAGRLLDAQKNR
jgi:hypothetical protein